ncbi:hypothetical protein HN51_063301 [Arachis hypogaea]
MFLQDAPPHLHKGSSVVIIFSIAGFNPPASMSMYGVTKTALFGVTKDNFGRLHDRSKKTPKVMKQLGRLFPNRVTIQLPQDETLLSD